MKQTGPGRILATCDLALRGATIAGLKWAYLFKDKPPSVSCLFTFVSTTDQPGLWVKEPKLVANGLHGYRTLRVASALDRTIVTSRADGPLIDLERYKDPRRHTKQIPQPDRYSYEFTAEHGALKITNDNGLQRWTDDANQLEPLTRLGTPAYCLAGPEQLLWSRSEVPRWETSDICGLSMHAWEGGYGAPDCLACLRPWPVLGKAYSARLTAMC